jgi:hypothetical protein
LYQKKGNKVQIAMIKETLERQTLNGTKWQIVVSQYGVTLFMNEKYSGYSFSTVADVNNKAKFPHHST